ncbi:TAF5-like RNA polymerase II p300/CBP-associated factor-associated factor 65 kDa subunit 5L [Daphnia carinata]|uniref:TAF5-like RNA polymerase II p300/CBP-associated factor-associated factor 65 kDa subunit 5L n=1 Tax=Daphnia carinata TaxID=120202 RepID=UPI00257F0206|nr:TAF5-like RNA polymerase II p300/CBP-associated factor-associated factor 65 kDa subunit 5L [Daphnia carinata]XP_059350149.1 TAF5-like RNA polymerase II p300/CBP-associated factor-associated factor 65 kDa subunit 5L [Daphnia carinata]
MEQTCSIFGGNMKRSKYESIINAAGRHLSKRNCTDSDVLKKSKLKLKQTAEQFENSAIWSQKIISIQNFSLTEQEADLQFSKLKAWVESLDDGARIEIDEILFPAFISLYRKLNVSGNTSGARGFYTRNQSNFFKVPELRKMAERFCSENTSHFILELSQEPYEILHSYIGSNEHPFLQQLLNTTLEINIMKTKIDSSDPSQTISKSQEDSSNMEEVQDLMAAISRLEELPPTAPLLKLYSIDTGQRRMSAASASPCQGYLSCGFQDSSVAIWDVKELRSLSVSNVNRSNLSESCAIGLYHPVASPLTFPLEPDSSLSICLGHSGPVYATQFTPNNTHMLSCSDDTTLRLWDMSSMENAVVYRGHTYPVWAMDISQQSQYFASASQDRTAKIWMFDRTFPLRILAGHTADVDCVTFHPNGLYLATGSADSSVRMWHVTEGKTVRILVGHRGTVLAVAFSPCGKLLASAGEDHRVKVWDVAAGSILHDYAGHHDVIHGLVWISESVLASYSADGNIRVWNVTQHSVPSSQLSQQEIASYSVSSPTKIVHLGRGNQSTLVCIAASD